ncbi:PilZ domain-containing protein [Caulobacter hibisci]
MFDSRSGAERRTSPRLSTNRSGKLLCGAFAWDCVIRDVSDGGARVQMLAGSSPPVSAQLVDLVGGLAHDVKVAWRKDRELGLIFLRSTDLRGLAPAGVQTAKRIWAAAQSRADAG